MLEQRIQQHFIDSADLTYHAAALLGKPMADAVQALLACVTSGGKILACGCAASAPQAQQLVMYCVAGFERERPEFAAMALGAGDAALPLARQVRALGQAGDVLVVFVAQDADAQVLDAVQAAHERDMSVVALTGRNGSGLATLLQETDVYLTVAHDRPARVREVHALVLHGLCDAMDAQLFGEQEEMP